MTLFHVVDLASKFSLSKEKSEFSLFQESFKVGKVFLFKVFNHCLSQVMFIGMFMVSEVKFSKTLLFRKAARKPRARHE